jgi:hypothetical protein
VDRGPSIGIDTFVELRRQSLNITVFYSEGVPGPEGVHEQVNAFPEKHSATIRSAATHVLPNVYLVTAKDSPSQVTRSSPISTFVNV